MIATAAHSFAKWLATRIGVTASALVTRFFAPFATLWHIAVALILIAVAILIWRAKLELPKVETPQRAILAGGFGAALAMTLANPGDIVLFAAVFAGLGVAVHTPLDHLLFCLTIFAGGCVYWIVLALLLDRWRAGLSAGHIRWLNRGSAALMVVAAAATLVSLARTPPAN